VIVLLHGQGGFPDYRFRFPLIARRCNRAGFNAATLVAPYHFQRAPRQCGAFSIPNHLLWAQSLAQGVAEIRALTGWLLGEGCPAVALWGISLGGGLAGLAVVE
jgi:pimeloyl-ACP methyl ester carboxylesterase